MGCFHRCTVLALLLIARVACAQATETGELGDEFLLFREIPVVVTATLREQQASRAPSSITVVDAKEIRQRGYRTLKDVMVDLPGWIDVSDSNEEIIAVRGIFASTGNKVLVLVNGHRMNDLNLGRYNTDQFIGLDVVERIEFIKGPGSVLYGTGALIGVVNIITRSGADLDGLWIKERVAVHEGGELDSETSLTWGHNASGSDLLINFTYLNAEGDKIDQPASLDRPPDGAPARSGVVYMGKYPRNWSFFSSLTHGEWRIDMRSEHSARAVPRCPNSAFYSWDAEKTKPLYEEDIAYIDAKYTHRFGDLSRLTINPGFTHYHLRELSWILSYGADRLPPYGSRGGQDTQYGQWQAKVDYERNLHARLNWITGLDAIVADFYDMNAVSGSDGSAFVLGAAERGTWTLAGGFTQIVWTPVDRLEVTAGTRLDTFDEFADPKVTSRGGLVYALSDRLTTKLLYGQSFLSPQWAHVKGVTSGAFAANPDIAPEEFEGWDWVCEYRDSRGLWASLSLFQSRVSGLISAGGQSHAYTNVNRISTHGLELESEWSLLRNLLLEGSYSYVRDAGSTSPSYMVAGEIKHIPRDVLRLGVTYSPLHHLDLTCWGRGVSQVRTSDNVTGATRISAWTTLDLSADLSLGDRWGLHGAVTNLTNEEYAVAGTINRPLPRPGLAGQVTVSFRP